MIHEEKPFVGKAGASGIPPLATAHGSQLVVAKKLIVYPRLFGPVPRRLDRDDAYMRYTEICCAVEIGKRVILPSAGLWDEGFITSRVVAFASVMPPRELSAADIEIIPRVRLDL
ncbi:MULTISPECIES: hypothetical protein [unclassified Cryobacterium]|uniref:hypothetical protein n=1 Tax=unclassified Cryobacterium TaxID=2649013 RepID=UPI000CE3BC8E|nr:MULTISPECIES: hypothetical protein [unclassified Cryobacterium]